MPGRHHFPLVDSLRAVAALAVLGTHAAAPAGLYSGGSSMGQFAARLEVGVPIFFLISGFLLYRPFARARIEGTPVIRTRAYAWRRFLRIAPAYWVALTAAAVIFGVPGVLTWSGIPTYYGVAQAYTTDTIGGGLVQGWTLTIEVAFYAFLPLFAWAVRRLPGSTVAARIRWELVAVGLLIGTGVAYKLVVLAFEDPDAVATTPALIALPAYFDQFGLGMLIAVLTVGVARGGQMPRIVRPIERYPGIAVAVAAVAFWAVSTRLGIDYRFFVTPIERDQYLVRHFLYTIVAVSLLLPAVIGDERQGLVRRVFGNRVMLYLGLVSYGIFLWNLLVVTQLTDWDFGSLIPSYGPLTYAAWVGATLAFTVVLASASWYLIERPALGLKGKVPPGTHEVSAGREA